MNAEFVALVSAVLKVPADAVSAELSPKTCKSWDSLATVNLVVTLEQHYKRVFSINELAEMSSVGAIWKLVSGLE